MSMHRRHHLLALAAACALATCSTTGEKAAPPMSSPAPASPGTSTASSATVNLASASGSLVSGTLSMAPMGDGVHITGQIGGLGAGQTHAIHVHEKGDCSAADASSAGGHFNPTGSPHGRAGTPTHHAGDMDNLTANAQGVADVNIRSEEHTSELQSLMRISYAVFCLKQKNHTICSTTIVSHIT